MLSSPSVGGKSDPRNYINYNPLNYLDSSSESGSDSDQSLIESPPTLTNNNNNTRMSMNIAEPHSWVGALAEWKEENNQRYIMAYPSMEYQCSHLPRYIYEGDLPKPLVEMHRQLVDLFKCPNHELQTITNNNQMHNVYTKYIWHYNNSHAGLSTQSISTPSQQAKQPCEYKYVYSTKTKSTPYSPNSIARPWTVQLTCHGAMIHAGHYWDKITAAKVADIYALVYLGKEKCKLNFPQFELSYPNDILWKEAIDDKMKRQSQKKKTSSRKPNKRQRTDDATPTPIQSNTYQHMLNAVDHSLQHAEHVLSNIPTSNNHTNNNNNNNMYNHLPPPTHPHPYTGGKRLHSHI